MSKDSAEISKLAAKIAKKKDGLLACYQVIAEQAPKLALMEAELLKLRRKKITPPKLEQPDGAKG
jgi:hypothetical protein